ncbi:hypothetical protein PI125_g14239 [Phytophthora idaei]|nr:hypothetical protein PI125_g14239 [Phytophthora idaei]
MDSDGDDNVLGCRQVAREMLESSPVKRLRGDWEMSRQRYQGLLLLSES